MMADDPDVALVQLGEALKQLDYRHITVTPATHARVNARKSNEWAKDPTGVFGWSRPFHAEIVPEPIFKLMQKAGITEACKDGWRSTLRVSALNNHLYFHSAWPTEPADAVFFGPDTYRYVEAMFQHFQVNESLVPRAVDIGCGAGPGAIELARRRPEAEVFAVDINDAALRLTRINAILAGASIHAKRSNLLTGLDGDFDLIIANPPYMQDPAARAYRHGGGTLGAGLSQDIIGTALQRLNPGGTLLLYTGSAIVDGIDQFRASTAKMLQGKCDWSYREIDPDVFGEELETDTYGDVDRIAAVLLCARMPGRAPKEN
ncbi:class I SAM-dependent methyltransferase [Alcaligenaceae bacterium]|nr:class I SAM-dependent methyltransferase [Alcaligenaceae bacterium]